MNVLVISSSYYININDENSILEKMIDFLRNIGNNNDIILYIKNMGYINN